MTGPIKRRLKVLENLAASRSQALRVVVTNAGKTAEQAEQREGIESGAEGVILVTFGD